jgi:hypothetical protein
MPRPASSTLSDMTVVFRPLQPLPHNAEPDELFDNGEVIPDALVPIEPLPKSFPTEHFSPQLVKGSYAIRVDLEVAPGKLLLSCRHLRGQPDAAGQPLSYVVFARHGLALSIPVYEPGRGMVDTPGRLYPLLASRW